MSFEVIWSPAAEAALLHFSLALHEVLHARGVEGDRSRA